MLTDVWSVIWLVFWGLAYLAYLFVLIYIIADIVRDRSLNGGLKALWFVFLVFLPFLTAVVYLIVRGRGMNERAAAHDNVEILPENRDEIRAGSFANPDAEIAKAQALLDAGTISAGEFDALKAKAAGSRF